MARKPPLAALMATPDEIEAMFYEALQSGDLERLMGLWVNDELVRCIHPGGPLLVGASRKSFLGQVSGAGPGERLPGSLAAAAWAAWRGAALVRVHDVAATVQLFAVLRAIATAEATW